MNRLAVLVMVATVVGMGVARAQQPVQPRPQVTRSYRSYSVAPAARPTAQRTRASSDATWRHADSKAGGHFSGGR